MHCTNRALKPQPFGCPSVPKKQKVQVEKLDLLSNGTSYERYHPFVYSRACRVEGSQPALTRLPNHLQSGLH